jgi:hypothetical protein
LRTKAAFQVLRLLKDVVAAAAVHIVSHLYVMAVDALAVLITFLVV